jgi:hypothetical protein
MLAPAFAWGKHCCDFSEKQFQTLAPLAGFILFPPYEKCEERNMMQYRVT